MMMHDYAEAASAEAVAAAAEPASQQPAGGMYMSKYI